MVIILLLVIVGAVVAIGLLAEKNATLHDDLKTAESELFMVYTKYTVLQGKLKNAVVSDVKKAETAVESVITKIEDSVSKVTKSKKSTK